MRFVFIFVVLLFLASCGISSNTIEAPKKDISGDGLEVIFDLDTSWLSQRQLKYSLNIKNSGTDIIELNRDNIKLKNSNGNFGESLFTSQSLEEFYNQFLREGDSLKLYQNTDLGDMEGVLELKEDFFEDLTYKNFDVILTIDYDTKTEFENTIEINLRDKELKLLDKLSQAAPIKIYDIKLFPKTSNQYLIFYYLRNTDSKTTAIINDQDIVFGANNRLNNCNYFREFNSDLKEKQELPIILNSQTKSVIYSCELDLSDVSMNNPTTFVSFGSFQYIYNIRLEEIINLPISRISSN